VAQRFGVVLLALTPRSGEGVTAQFVAQLALAANHPVVMLPHRLARGRLLWTRVKQRLPGVPAILAGKDVLPTGTGWTQSYLRNRRCLAKNRRHLLFFYIKIALTERPCLAAWPKDMPCPDMCPYCSHSRRTRSSGGAVAWQQGRWRRCTRGAAGKDIAQWISDRHNIYMHC